jgi:hypothetical protein
VYFSQINPILYGKLLKALVRISIKRLRQIYSCGGSILSDRNIFLQMTGNESFSVKNIWHLHLQLLHIMSPAPYVE